MPDASFNIKLTADVQAAISSLRNIESQLNQTGNAATKASKQVSEAGSKISEGFKSFSEGFGIGAGIAGFEAVGEAIKGSFEEAIEAEQAASKLKNTLEGVGRIDLFEHLQKKAEEFANTFKYIDNDEVTGVFQKLITFGKLTQKQIEDLIPVIVNFAAKTGTDINSASETIIKALEGQGKVIKQQFGVNLKEAGDTAGNLGVIMSDLADKVKGAADAFGETTAGKIKITQQSFKDLKEEVGTNLLPVLNGVLQGLNFVIIGLSDVGSRLKGVFLTIFDPQGEALRQVQKFNDKLAEEANNIAETLDILFSKEDLTKLKGRLAIEEATLRQNEKTIKSTNKSVTDDDKDYLAQRIATSKAVIEQLRKEIEDRKKITLGNTSNTKPKKDAEDPLKALKEEIKSLETLNKLGALATPDQELLINLKAKLQIEEIKGNKLIPEEQKQRLISAVEGEANKTISDINERLSKPSFLNLKLIPLFKFLPPEDDDVSKNSDIISKAFANKPLTPTLKIKPELILDNKALRLKSLEDSFEHLIDDVAAEIKNLAVTGLSSIGESIGEALSGSGFGFESIAQSLGTALGDSLIQIGKLTISYAIKIEAIKQAIKKLVTTPVGAAIAIGLGIVAIALGTALKNSVSKQSPKFAQGGIVNQATFGTFGEAGPEAVIPLDRLPGLIGNNRQELQPITIGLGIRGNEIVPFLERAQAKFNRIH